MSLQAALYAGPFFALLSFGAYLFAAIYVEEDKKNVEIAVKSERKIKFYLKKLENNFPNLKREPENIFRFAKRQAERRENQRGYTGWGGHWFGT